MNRREMIKLSQSTFIYLIAGKTFFGELVSAQARREFERSDLPTFLTSLPRFEGVYLIDSNTLNAFSRDFGLNVSSRPQGVLRPANASDIQKMAVYCLSRNIPLTIRGAGGSAYGQSQSKNGIVVDTTTLRKIRWVSANEISVDVGLIWKEVTDFTLTKKMTPPVLPDTLVTTVGGQLSAGGIGETSYNLGSLADHITQIQLVTLGGEIKTASPQQNSDLFFSALGGMGQTSIITQVHIRLQRAPDTVQTLEYSYDFEDPQMFLDMLTFQRLEPQGALGGHFLRPQNGSRRWKYQMHASFWGRDSAPWISQVRGELIETKKRKFVDYINRNTQDWINAVNSGALERPRPYLSYFMPMETGFASLKYLFSNPDSLLGVSRFYLSSLQRKSFKRPFLSLPNSEDLLHFRLYKVIKDKPGSQEHLLALKSNNQDLIPRILNNGGTMYLPFSRPLNSQEIKRQYSPRTWQAFAQLKQHYDRQGLLNPGVGLF